MRSGERFGGGGRSLGSGREGSGVDELLLNQLLGLLAGMAFPADKEEVLARLRQRGAVPAVLELVQAMPGLDFAFASDVISTARIALEMEIERPWPAHASQPDDRPLSDESCGALEQRLLRCRQANGHLVRITQHDGVVYLDGRTPDVPRGVWAAKVARGFVPLTRIVNRLRVTS